MHARRNLFYEQSQTLTSYVMPRGGHHNRVGLK